jgi:hypothetical protein
MRQKYVVLRDDEKNELHIQEFAELDKEILSLLCGETYNIDSVKSAAAEGKTALIAALRTQNMYPPGIYANKIADTVTELLKAQNGQSAAEVFLDDLDYVTRGRVETEMVEDIDEEAADIDDLLVDDTIDEEFTDDEDINISPNSSIKIADDDALDIEDDV